MNIKRYYLLKCHNNSNMVIAEEECVTITGAISSFKGTFPNLKLDEHGYYKIGDVTYCVAIGWNC